MTFESMIPFVFVPAALIGGLIVGFRIGSELSRPPTPHERSLAEHGDEMVARMERLALDRETIQWTQECVRDAKRKVAGWPA